jgi:hypothetical protein
MYCKLWTMSVVTAAIAIVAGNAMGAPTFFTNRSAFNAAAGGGLNFEGFEGSWNDTVAGTAVFSGFSLSETGGTNNLFHATEAGGGSFSVTEGIDSPWYDDNGSSIGSFFSFGGAPVRAFGLDITFARGNGSLTTSTVTIGGSVNSSINLVANVHQFWGVIDPAGLSSISFNASGNGFVGFDAVAFGAVPEPAGMALLVVAAVASGVRCRLPKRGLNGRNSI